MSIKEEQRWKQNYIYVQNPLQLYISVLIPHPIPFLILFLLIFSVLIKYWNWANSCKVRRKCIKILQLPTSRSWILHNSPLSHSLLYFWQARFQLLFLARGPTKIFSSWPWKGQIRFCKKYFQCPPRVTLQTFFSREDPTLDTSWGKKNNERTSWDI
jgi:hypothetical protein